MYLPTDMILEAFTDKANSVDDIVISSFGNEPLIELKEVSNIPILDESFINPIFELNARTSYFTCNAFVISYLIIFSYGVIVVVATPFSIINPPFAL